MSGSISTAARASFCEDALSGKDVESNEYVAKIEKSDPIDEHPTLILAKKLIELKTKPMKSRVLFDSPNHGATIETYGVPANAKQLFYRPTDIFRYYVSDSAVMKMILESGQLKAGQVPYAVVKPYLSKEYFYSLDGLFVTTPEFEPWQVGLDKKLNTDFVDFTLPDGLGLIQLEPGIILLPGKPDIPQWIQNSYQRYVENGSAPMPNGMEDAFKRVETFADQPDLVISVNIVKYRQSGNVNEASPH